MVRRIVAKMNRVTIFLCSASVLLVSCWKSGNRQNNTTALIEGKITHPQPGKMVYLLRQGVDKNQLIDSVRPDENGNFRITLPITSPAFYSLNLYNVQFIDLVLARPETIQIQAAGQMEGDFKITGSADTEYLLEFYELEKSFRKKNR